LKKIVPPDGEELLLHRIEEDCYVEVKYREVELCFWAISRRTIDRWV